MATSPGTPGRENEDFVAAVPGAVVLIDGAGIRGIEEICRHGIAWYARSLGGTLLGRLARDDGRPLADLLAEAIEEVTDAHRDTCDVTNPSSPSATVAMLRIDGEGADYLVLADTTVVLQGQGVPFVVHDPREGACRRSVEGLPHDEAIKVFRASRNQPDGFWVAKDDPAAAEHVLAGRFFVLDLDSVALFSNGASRIVDRFGLADWRETLELLETEGPAELIGFVRRTEAEQAVAPDDATVAYCTQLAEWLDR